MISFCTGGEEVLYYLRKMTIFRIPQAFIPKFFAMPFTFAHPAAILPFKNIKWLSMSAMVVGSLCPDFEYFFRLKLHGRYGHSLEGMFLLDIPMALLLLFLFHEVVKKPLIDHLPFYFQSRLQSLRAYNFLQALRKNTPAILLSILLGVSTHVLWDSFTHANTFLVNHLDFLRQPVDFSFLPRYPLFRYLQHLSTLLGTLAILVVFHRMPTRIDAGRWQFKSLFYFITVFTFALALFELRRWFGFEYYGDVITVLMASMMFGFVGAGVVWTFFIVKR